MTNKAIDRSRAETQPAPSRRISGTQLKRRDEADKDGPPTLPATAPESYSMDLDPDTPTQPETESPVRNLAVDLPRAGHDETRDTIPSPPPDRE